MLVEDDFSLGETLRERIKKEGYSISWAKTIRNAKEEIDKKNPDLILLDVGLPDGSGFDFAGEIAKKSDRPPFLFLTAIAGAQERLKGFELGAEEFIPKPFHLKELLLRIKHVLDSHRHIHETLLEKKTVYDSHTIDFEKFKINSPDGSEIALSARDCGLLKLLISENHRTVSRDEILDLLWGEENFPTNRTIDNSIVRLRQALGKNGQKAIQSIRGVGYRWVGNEGEKLG